MSVEQFNAGCTLSFEAIKFKHPIDDSCVIEGEGRARSQEQNKAKNNFSASGTTLTLTVPIFRQIEKASNFPAGGPSSPATDRSIYHVTLRSGTSFAEGDLVRLVGYVTHFGTSRPMRFTGPLMFDANHKACPDGGRVKPPRLSSWEIHPIYKADVCKNKTIASSRDKQHALDTVRRVGDERGGWAVNFRPSMQSPLEGQLARVEAARTNQNTVTWMLFALFAAAMSVLGQVAFNAQMNGRFGVGLLVSLVALFTATAWSVLLARSLRFVRFDEHVVERLERKLSVEPKYSTTRRNPAFRRYMASRWGMKRVTVIVATTVIVLWFTAVLYFFGRFALARDCIVCFEKNVASMVIQSTAPNALPASSSIQTPTGSGPAPVATDPAWFYSTLAQSTAAIVGLMAGLFASRFVDHLNLMRGERKTVEAVIQGTQRVSATVS